MVAYLGKPGFLVPFKCPSGLDVRTERPSSEDISIGGRVVEFRAPKARRAWQVDISTATPDQLAGLQSLVQAGTPPWVWVEPYAVVTNLLTPEQSVLEPGTWNTSGTGVIAGGSAWMPDGTFAVRTLQHASGGTMDFGYTAGSPDRPAVLPGQPADWSAYLRGSGVLGLSFRDSLGQVLADHTAAYSTATWTRVGMNRTAPAGAASVRLWASGALQGALPRLAWTADRAPWAFGRGCNKASVSGLSEAVQMAVAGQASMRRSGVSFNVMERG